MYVGTSKNIITPQNSTRLCGYATRTSNFQGIKEDIYVRVQVHQKDNEKIVFIYADLLWWGTDFVDPMRVYLSDKFEIKSDNIFFIASHNHSGPATGKNFTDLLETYDEAYALFLKEKVTMSIEEALGDIEEVTGELYCGQSNLNVFRRTKVQGKITMSPNYDIEVDKSLTIVGLYRMDGSLKGLMVHYPCHANLSNQNYVQPDYPGVALRMLDQQYPGSISIFLQGCTADIRPNVVIGNKFSACTYEQVVEFANLFYEDCLTTLRGSSAPLIFNFKSERKEVALYQENLKEIDEIKLLQQSKEVVERQWAGKILEKNNRNYEVLEISKIEYADKISFLTFNAEVSQAYSKLAKSLDETVISMGYVNGMIGYISTKEQIIEGGYEPEGSALYFALSGTYKQEIEEIIHKNIRKLI